jgi:predicted RNase H-like HicB family nuclease
MKVAKVMEILKNLVIIERTTEGYSAFLPELPGCVCTGSSIQEIKHTIWDTVEFHLEGLRLEQLEIPESFEGEFQLAYKMDVESLFDWFTGILTKSGLSRITGMNQSLISQYANGTKTPGGKQTRKIEQALHNLGQELLEIKL